MFLLNIIIFLLLYISIFDLIILHFIFRIIISIMIYMMNKFNMEYRLLEGARYYFLWAYLKWHFNPHKVGYGNPATIVKYFSQKHWSQNLIRRCHSCNKHSLPCLTMASVTSALVAMLMWHLFWTPRYMQSTSVYTYTIAVPHWLRYSKKTDSHCPVPMTKYASLHHLIGQQHQKQWQPRASLTSQTTLARPTLTELVLIELNQHLENPYHQHSTCWKRESSVILHWKKW